MKTKKINQNSIEIIKNIYYKHSKKFLNYAIETLNTIKLPNSVINEDELKEYIFNNVLRDIHLSQYMQNKIFNLAEVDIIPESYTTYGEDAKYLDDAEIDENEDFNSIKSKKENRETQLVYNEELASDLWSNIMIYGGIQEYQKMIENIIKDVEKINKNAAVMMKK